MKKKDIEIEVKSAGVPNRKRLKKFLKTAVDDRLRRGDHGSVKYQEGMLSSITPLASFTWTTEDEMAFQEMLLSAQ